MHNLSSPIPPPLLFFLLHLITSHEWYSKQKLKNQISKTFWFHPKLNILSFPFQETTGFLITRTTGFTQSSTFCLSLSRKLQGWSDSKNFRKAKGKLNNLDPLVLFKAQCYVFFPGHCRVDRVLLLHSRLCSVSFDWHVSLISEIDLYFVGLCWEGDVGNRNGKIEEVWGTGKVK